MAEKAHDLDAHAKPPARLREVYKKYQKLPTPALDADEEVFDHQNGKLAGFLPIHEQRKHLPEELKIIFDRFLASTPALDGEVLASEPATSHPIYEHPDVPGLLIYPSLFPPAVQISLLNKLLHRDLSNPAHKTNMHLHYNIPYPASSPTSPTTTTPSFFSPTASTLTLTPLDPSIHNPLTTSRFLNKKLRWLTLGGQYDWTLKQYPSSPPPAFPPDVADLVEGCFPDMRAQAAIVNLYSPGDTLSLHRDVSEECGRPLVSVSLGCDAVFVVGLDNSNDGDGGEGDGDGAGRAVKAVTVRLRSGDAVVMSGKARFAWHAVPQIVRGSCAEWMREWPAVGEAGEEMYGAWRGWMEGKRVNLNVRQMWE